MTNDYQLMLRTSPVQKEWKPKDSDMTNEGLVSSLSREYLFKLGTRPFWLPRQDDWQEIAQKSGKFRLSLPNFLYMANWIQDNITQIQPVIQMNNMTSISERDTILWCLFVHKEVYGLVWDWDEKKWKQ